MNMKWCELAAGGNATITVAYDQQSLRPNKYLRKGRKTLRLA
jgi:hypothetical protein